MKAYLLPYMVIRVAGNAATFLNGLTSNTLDARQNAFVNQHGRIIATFFQHKTSDDQMLIAVPSVAVDALLAHLDRYARLNRTQLERTDLKAFMDQTGAVTITAQTPAALGPDQEFTRFRLDHNIPLMGIDYQADDFLLNVSDQDFVSYTKGCFLGQEPVAKVHNRSKPTYKLVVLPQSQVPADARGPMTSVVTDGGEPRGFVFVKNS